MKKIGLFSCFGLSALLAAAALAQTPPSAAPPTLPTDPAALLQLGSKVNGLHGPGLNPWHVRASWQILDDKGQPLHHGTYEEWWAADDEFKVDLVADGFHQIRWATAQGDFTSGDPGWPAWVFTFVQNTLLDPLPDGGGSSDTRLKFESTSRPTPSGVCVLAGEKHEKRVTGKFCFTDGKAAIRLNAGAVTQANFDGIMEFHDRFLARAVHLLRVGMPAIEMYLDAVDDLVPAPGEFNPPANAVAAPPWAHVPKGMIIGKRLSGEDLFYPSRTERQRGYTVIELWGVIGLDGRLRNAEIIGAPAELQQQAPATMKTWRFEVSKLNGVPIEAAASIMIEIETL
ncbi:MAG TPA: hypothetical protein VHX60_08315 [Acidobacteriaceae bacterium]|jgi:hypothetical protein|nr:hypothetical protein [Acidobacteriaceae bacterium]